MQGNCIPTNEYYHRLLAEPDTAVRQQLYLDLFVQPWQQMMSMVQGPNSESDPLAGARAWGWLLPDQQVETAVLLAQMEAAQAWEIGQDALDAACARFAPYARRIPFNTVSGWLLLADAARANPPEYGYTGATHWLKPQLIGQFWELNEYNLLRLGSLIAHEMHHLIRLRAFPWDMQHTSVADYIITEGTAEAFAASLFGEDKVGYFITDFNTDELETARRMIEAGLEATGFNVIRSYIFGDAMAERSGFEPLGGMPTYGGYAIGYRVVQAFLERSGCSIEETTFMPSLEIVRGSGFFE